MHELDHFVVANPSRIACTVRTLKPFWTAGDLKPWCHYGQLADALLYLAVRSSMPDEEVRALKELFERLSCSLNGELGSQDRPPEGTENTNVR